MTVTGTAVMTTATYKAAIRALLKRALYLQRTFGIVIAAMGLLSVALADQDSIAVGIALLVVASLFVLVLPRRALSVSVKRAEPALTGPWHYEVADDGLRIANPIGSSHWPWQSMSRVEDHPELWLVRTVIKNQAIVIAKAAFSESDQAAVAAILARNVGAGAGGAPTDALVRPPQPPGAQVRPPA